VRVLPLRGPQEGPQHTLFNEGLKAAPGRRPRLPVLQDGVELPQEAQESLVVDAVGLRHAGEEDVELGVGEVLHETSVT
jgi:hypothetical protein